MNLNEAKQILLNSSGNIEQTVVSEMQNKKFSYETFGKEIETSVLDLIIEIFDKAGQKEIRKAKDKNEFPDLTVTLSDGVLAIDIKAGNRYKKSDGCWKACNNSENDLGTIRSWPNKLSKFGGDNIYYVFIEYSISDKLHQVEAVRIAPFYEFLDINTKGFLKYRKKDGNLRPKDFGVPAKIKSVEQFESLLILTAVERAKSIIREHIETIPKEQRNALLDELKAD
jgi:hypothetical protein